MEEISGMAITKLLDTKLNLALTLKLKFIRNRAMLKVTNGAQEKVIFNPEHVVGIVDLRSLCCIMPCQCKDKIHQYHDRFQFIAILM